MVGNKTLLMAWFLFTTGGLLITQVLSQAQKSVPFPENWNSLIKAVPPFPEGSLIVFVNFEDKEGKKPRLFLVMHKDKEYGQTGGWGWEDE